MVFEPEALISGLETRDVLQSMQQNKISLISINGAADQRLCFLHIQKAIVLMSNELTEIHYINIYA